MAGRADPAGVRPVGDDRARRARSAAQPLAGTRVLVSSRPAGIAAFGPCPGADQRRRRGVRWRCRPAGRPPFRAELADRRDVAVQRTIGVRRRVTIAADPPRCGAACRSGCPARSGRPRPAPGSRVQLLTVARLDAGRHAAAGLAIRLLGDGRPAATRALPAPDRRPRQRSTWAGTSGAIPWGRAGGPAATARPASRAGAGRGRPWCPADRIRRCERRRPRHHPDRRRRDHVRRRRQHQRQLACAAAGRAGPAGADAGRRPATTWRRSPRFVRAAPRAVPLADRHRRPRRHPRRRHAGGGGGGLRRRPGGSMPRRGGRCAAVPRSHPRLRRPVRRAARRRASRSTTRWAGRPASGSRTCSSWPACRPRWMATFGPARRPGGRARLPADPRRCGWPTAPPSPHIVDVLERALVGHPGGRVGSYPALRRRRTAGSRSCSSRADPGALEAAAAWMGEAPWARCFGTVIVRAQPRHTQSAAAGGRAPHGGAAAGRRRRRLRKDAGADPPRRAPDRRGPGRPAEILAITFTNRAATEMKERVEQLVGGRIRGSMWVMTFHSACGRMLRRDAELIGYRSSFTIYDQADQVRLVTQLLEEQGKDPKRFVPRVDPRRHLAGEGQAADAGAVPDQIGAFFEQSVAEVYDVYERRMHAANAMDFDDLIMKTVLPAGGVPGRPPALAATLPLRDGRRVPGHQPRAVQAGLAALGREAHATWPSSAIRISRSTPSGAPTSATSPSSSRTSPTPA